MTRALSWVALGLIVMVTLITYREVVGNSFVLDDFHTVRDNPSVRSLTLVDQWFSFPYATSGDRQNQNYRPILIASYAADYAVWGERPTGFHTTNLAIHVGVVVLAFLLARKLWGDDLAALFAAGVFALHPINAETVNYASARSSSLSTLFILAAILVNEWTIAAGTRPSGVGAGRAGPRRWLIVALGLGAMALGTKETAIVLPVLLLVWDRGRRPGAWRTTWLRLAPWVGLVVLYLMVRSWVLSGANLKIGSTIDQNLLFAVKVCLSSLKYWIWPSGLAVDHAWPIRIGMGEGWFLALGAFALALSTAAVVHIDRRVGWCILWFWAALLPVSALAFVTRYFLYQDNRTYLAGIGLAWAAGAIGASVTRLSGSRPVMRATWVMICIGLLVVAVRQDLNRTAVWVDSTHLWADVLAQYPENVHGRNMRGLALLDAGRVKEAQETLEQALRLQPELPKTHNHLGMAYSRLGEWEKAAAAFEQAIRLDPRYVWAYLHLGETYEALGRWNDAAVVYESLLRRNEAVAYAWARLGQLFERQGRFEEAAERYRKGLALDPTNDEIREALDGVLQRLEQRRNRS